MSETVIFGAEDRWQAFTDATWASACIETGFKNESQCPVMPLARRIGDVSLTEGLDAIFGAPDGAELLRWLASNRLSALSPEVRMRLLTELGRCDPCYAGGVYLWQADLTDEEDAVLYAAFAPEMPMLVERVKRDPNCGAKVRAAHG